MPPTPVRVVLADMSRLNRELIRRILEEAPGIDVVSEVPDGGPSFRRLLEEAGAEVVIIGSEADGLLADCRALLGEPALRRVIAVSTDAREAQLYGVRPYEMRVEDFSPEFVVEAVRSS